MRGVNAFSLLGIASGHPCGHLRRERTNDPCRQPDWVRIYKHDLLAEPLLRLRAAQLNLRGEWSWKKKEHIQKNSFGRSV